MESKPFLNCVNSRVREPGNPKIIREYILRILLFLKKKV